MRSSLSIRLLRVLLACWFVLSGAELGFVHACPMHGASAVQGAAGHAGHGGHVAAAGMSRVSSTPDAPAPDGAHHLCTCVGACSAASALVVLVASPAVQAPRVVQLAAPVLADVRVAPVTRGAHVLPFGNGPPARALTA